MTANTPSTPSTPPGPSAASAASTASAASSPTPTPTQSATPLDDVCSYPAYALIRFQGSDQVTLLGGSRVDHEWLADIALDDGPPPPGRRFDRLVCVPYAQVRERGFEANDDGAPLTSIEVEHEARVGVDDLLGLLPDDEIATVGAAGFDIDDDAYADIVRRIID